MKPDGLVIVLGEACVNGKAAESTEQLISFSRHINMSLLLYKYEVWICSIQLF